MGSHLNHLVFSQPIFDKEGTLVAFASTMAHWQDIGGTLAGTTTDIYSEGLQLPICKIFKKGRQDPELTNIIKANVRLPTRHGRLLRAGRCGQDGRATLCCAAAEIRHPPDPQCDAPDHGSIGGAGASGGLQLSGWRL